MMGSDTTPSIPEEPSIEDRLLESRKLIQKLTRDAVKKSHDDDDVVVSSSTSSSTYSSDSKASFQLGMELFGQEVSHVEKKVQERLVKIEQDLQTVLEQVGEHNNTENNSNNNSEHKSTADIQRETQQLQTKVRFLQHCSSARSLLDESLALSSSATLLEPNLPQAAVLLQQATQQWRHAHAIVATAQQQQQDSPTIVLVARNSVLEPIRMDLQRQKLQLLGDAQKTWHTAVTLQSNTLTVKQQGQSLKIAYQVMDVFANDSSNNNKALEDMLSTFTRDLQHKVFQPLLDCHMQGKQAPEWNVTHEQNTPLGPNDDAAAAKGSIRRLEWVKVGDNDDANNTNSPSTRRLDQIQSWKHTAHVLQQVLSFLVSHVLLDRENLVQFVGKRLFGTSEIAHLTTSLEEFGLSEPHRIGKDDHGLLREPLLKALQVSCIPTYMEPNQVEELSHYKEILDTQLTPLLEQTIQPMHDHGATRLRKFVSTFEQTYIEQRRCTLLNEARELLLTNDYHNTIQVGVDARPSDDDKRLGLEDGLSVFKLHQSSVSDTAFQLMQKCRQTMEECVHQKTFPQESALALLAPTLFQTAREMLDLFRAIVPVRYAKEVQTVPRTAAVLHNDGVFLAHHCLTLGLEYKDQFPPVPENDTRGNLLRRSCSFVDLVPLFRDLAEQTMANMLEFQAHQIAELVGDRLAMFGPSLRSDDIVAEWSEAEDAVNAALYHLRHIRQTWKPILAHQVQTRSIGYLADVLFGLFLDQTMAATDISMNACQFVHAQFQKAAADVLELLEGENGSSRLWDRFQAVGKFMDMSIADIQVALSDGVFRSITSPELSKLVKACFDDSQKRRALLKLLTASQH